MDCNLQEFMVYKKILEGGRGERKAFLNIRKKSNTANYSELPIRLTGSHRGHSQWLFFTSELHFNPSSFLLFHSQPVQDPNGFFATLFLMGLLASRKPCQIIIIQLLSGTPVVTSTSPSAPLLLTLAGEVFFLLGKLQIKNLAVWPCPACSSKSLAALPAWWSFFTIALSLAIHIYTLANKKGICKIIFFSWSNK